MHTVASCTCLGCQCNDCTATASLWMCFTTSLPAMAVFWQDCCLCLWSCCNDCMTQVLQTRECQFSQNAWFFRNWVTVHIHCCGCDTQPSLSYIRWGWQVSWRWYILRYPTSGIPESGAYSYLTLWILDLTTTTSACLHWWCMYQVESSAKLSASYFVSLGCLTSHVYSITKRICVGV